MIETVMNEINIETASLCLMNESLKKHTTYRIGGPADLMIFPKSKQDLIKVVEIINENKIQLTILGSGSNVLVSDNGIRGAVISLKNSLKQIEVDDNILYAECGTMLGKIVKYAETRHISLNDLSLDEFKKFSNKIKDDVDTGVLNSDEVFELIFDK